MAEAQPLVPRPGEQIDLGRFDPAYTGKLSEQRARSDIKALRERLAELQDVLYADERHALLVVLQGLDGSGKDSTIQRVFGEVNLPGLAVESFGVPSEEERSHDFLWRHHLRMPRRGHIMIHNRSHYESVLVERVRKFTPREVWEKRYQQINDFEAMLAAERTVILKFYLHISKEEQRVQLQERIDDPRKTWKYRAGDLEDRKLWDEYMAAFEDAIWRCNTEWAPWHVVPSDHRWYRDVVIARAVVEALERLELRYPPGDPALKGTVIE